MTRFDPFVLDPRLPDHSTDVLLATGGNDTGAAARSADPDAVA